MLAENGLRPFFVHAACAVALGVGVGSVAGCGSGSIQSTSPPPATITSFTASPPTIAGGASSSLTAVFANGTGVITPGNLSVTSGAAVSVSPAATTTYTLTVTPSSGAAATQTVTVTVVPTPTITSFTANPATIASGTSSSLTAIFANGAGVITPGNLSVTSGTAVSVSPAATTTYTLTVTPAAGAAITQTVTVTVAPAPTITSFTANPATIASGTSSSLTAIFANGAGVITPGNLSVTSGTAVSVSPAATTTYTLTVTPSLGSAVTKTVTVTVASGSSTSITVDQSSTGPAVTDQLLGMNMAVWYDPTTAAILPAFQTAGIQAVRWPGGSDSDLYHWATNTLCDGGYADANSTFANFVNDLVIPGGLDAALTANYGSNAACNGPGDPTEAAAWASAAVTDGAHVSHITVGNEVYGSWEYDLHAKPNDPTTYAAAVVGASGYYQLIKAADPNVLVGVVVDADNTAGGWDNIVLANAKGSYDFVEYHYYPETPGQENDTTLIHQLAQGLTTNLNTVKAELAKWGTAGTPIYVGEMGSVYTNPGKQSTSITQALFAGQTLGEMMNDGVSRATWWIGFGGCEDSASGTGANFSSSLYGWQNYGGYMVFSDGLPDGYDCNNETLAAGTLLPTARAYQLFSNVAVKGETVLTATVAGDTTDVRAYAATNNGGTALVVFNLNETTSEPVTITLSGQTATSGVTVETYSKAIYDQSQNNVWAGPTTAASGSQNLPLMLTLDPWSMNVVIVK